MASIRHVNYIHAVVEEAAAAVELKATFQSIARQGRRDRMHGCAHAYSSTMTTAD